MKFLLNSSVDPSILTFLMSSLQKMSSLCIHLRKIKYKQEKIIIFRPYFIWERKIFKSNGFFFLQNLPRFYLYLNLRVLPIEFNPHKFSFVRYVFVEIFEVFLKNDENDENDPLMTK